jgi:competence protein ComEC
LKRLVLLVAASLLIIFAGLTIATSAVTPGVLINEVEVNPPGTDSGAEQVELYNPSANLIDVSGWSISSTAGRTATVTIDDGTIIAGKSYLVIGKDTQWLDNSGEIVELADSSGVLVDSAGPFDDDDNDAATWQRSPDGSDDWVFDTSTLGSANIGTSTDTISPSPQPSPVPPSEPTPSPIEEPVDSNPPSSSSGTSVPDLDASEGELKIIIIDVGQGDSILIILPNKNTLLIDGGERESSDNVLEVLDQYGLNHIDVAIATHPHADHIGGLIDVIETIDVGQVLDSGQIHTTKTFEDLLDAIDAAQIPLTSVRAGETINLDQDVKMDVLNPPASLADGADDEDEFNDNSVVLKITYGEFSALLTGDMQETNEVRLVSENASLLDVDVLKAGHHGSHTSSTSSFLDAVTPEAVAISAGAGNNYGHPHQEALNRINDAGTQHVFRTDEDGTIIITSTGSNEYTVETTGSHKTVVVPEFGAGIIVAGIALSSVVIIFNRDRLWKRSSKLV